MRLKSYYTINETQLNLYTTGSKYMFPDQTEYIGLYHRYTITDEVYTLASWNPNQSKKLLPYKIINPIKVEFQKINPNIKTEYKLPVPKRTIVTVKDRENGFINRYFIQKVNTLEITEIDKDQFDDYNNKKIDPNMYRVTQIKWTITGLLITAEINGIYTPSVQRKNKTEIDKIKNTWPGLAIVLFNLSQYYSDTDFNVPKDINPTSFIEKYQKNLDS